MSARHKSLWPREHGAYLQVGFPLLTAMIVGGASVWGLVWCVVVVTTFLAHEPVVVLLGHRGGRTLKLLGNKARSQLAVLGFAAVVGMACLLATAPTRIVWSMVPSVALAMPLGVLVWHKKQKTVVGELLVVFGFSLASLPVMEAAGQPMVAQGVLAGCWAAILTLGTVSVRGIIKHKKRPGGAMLPSLVVAVAIIAVAAWGWSNGIVNVWHIASMGPSTALALVYTVRPPHPRHLRTLGFVLLGVFLFSAVCLVIAFQ